VFLDISQTGARLLVAGEPPAPGPAFLTPPRHHLSEAPDWVEFEILASHPRLGRRDQHEVRGRFTASCSYSLFQSALEGLDLSSSRHAIASLSDPSENDSLVWR
jgi:hypothetical protein